MGDPRMIGGGGLTLRAGGVIAVTVAAALAFALLLAFLKFDQKLRDVAVSRLSMTAEEVRRQSETGLGLGLDLAELEDLTAVLTRAARARDVVRIDVWDAAGRVLFSSDPASVGTTADAVGLDAVTGDRYRRRVRGDELLVTADLRDGYGRNVGEVAVTASLAGQRAGLETVRGELRDSATPVIVAALLATLLAVAATVRLTTVRGEPAPDQTAPEADAAKSLAASEKETRA